MTDSTFAAVPVYRVVIDRVGHNQRISPLVIAAAGREELAAAVVAHGRRYREGVLRLDLARTGAGLERVSPPGR